MQVERSDHPHLLEWHSAHCVALAEHCEAPQVRKMLRLLAADLALEAEVLRRKLRTMAVAATSGR
jgi:hypothetical protein